MVNKILRTVFPKVCSGCGKVISEDEFLCDYCFSFIENTDFGKLCTKCGNYKSKCVCKTRTFHYGGVTAPFLNSGIAKKAMYSFKFRHNEAIAQYFSEQMVLAVKQSFYDVKFDAVCYVPIEKLKFLKRGYNQSQVLAEKIAAVLEIPFYDNVFGFRKHKNTQHKSYGKERFKNIKDVYFVKKPLLNKTVLLVDDIKTTGATLSECARILMLSNSNNVYCVTGLITERKEKKNGN